MHTRMRVAARLAAVGGLAMLLSTAAFAAPQQDYRGQYQFRADRISTQGRITSMTREGNQYSITLNHGEYSYYVPLAMVRNRDLRVGDQIRIGGLVTGDTVSADMVAFVGEPYYTSDPAYRGVPFGSTGWMSGTVQRADRHLGYLEVRDDSTGEVIKIDVRHMNLRRPVNVWGVRAGEHISINGSWEHRDTFDARLIQY